MNPENKQLTIFLSESTKVRVYFASVQSADPEMGKERDECGERRS